jgi:steroid 5-alpha reductase family enzyme
MVSITIKNAGIADIFWGLGFVIANICYFIFSGSDFNPRNILILTLVTIWGLRLTIYVAFRNTGKGEDFRYREFRDKYGEKRYWWISLFQVFLLQGVILMLVSITLLGSFSDHNEGTGLLDYLAMLLWIIGFCFEAGGDWQLSRFRKNPLNKGRVLDKGFWRYTRHPNYFGDAAIWWSFALLSIAAGNWINIAGALLMTFLLVRVSGVALLEKSLKKTKPEYKEYEKKTSAFFPWVPRK